MTKRKKILIITVAAVLAAVLTVIGVLTALGSFTEYKATEATALTEVSEGYVEENTPIFKIYNSENMKLLAESGFMGEDDVLVPATSTNVVTLTATVLPEDASDKRVDWTVEFVNPTSSWASGKNAANYISAIPATDGANEVSVYALFPFAEQIKIVATSRANSNVSAYAVADYGERLDTYATLVFDDYYFSCAETITSGDAVNTVTPIPLSSTTSEIEQYFISDFRADVTFLADYTEPIRSYSYFIQVIPSYEFYNALKDEGLAKAENDWSAHMGNTIGEFYNALCNAVVIPDGTQATLERADAFNRAVAAAECKYHFQVKVTVETDYETKSYFYSFLFDKSRAEFLPTEMNLNYTVFIL